MSIHFMIIMLSFVAPVHEDLPLIEAPQVVAPGSLAEYHAVLDQLEALRRQADAE